MRHQGDKGPAPADIFREAMASADWTPQDEAIQRSKVAAVRHQDEARRAASHPQQDLELQAAA